MCDASWLMVKHSVVENLDSRLFWHVCISFPIAFSVYYTAPRATHPYGLQWFHRCGRHFVTACTPTCLLPFFWWHIGYRRVEHPATPSQNHEHRAHRVPIFLLDFFGPPACQPAAQSLNRSAPKSGWCLFCCLDLFHLMFLLRFHYRAPTSRPTTTGLKCAQNCAMAGNIFDGSTLWGWKICLECLVAVLFAKKHGTCWIYHRSRYIFLIFIMACAPHITKRPSERWNNFGLCLTPVHVREGFECCCAGIFFHPGRATRCFPMCCASQGRGMGGLRAHVWILIVQASVRMDMLKCKRVSYTAEGAKWCGVACG